MAGGGRADHRDVMGAAMVLVGLGFFVVVFVALFPVLTNPAGAYDRWFPSGEATIEESAIEGPTTAEATELPVAPPVAGPTARFRWEASVIDAFDPPIYRMRLSSESVPGDAEIVTTRWELGDGTTATGASITHDYPEIGSYTILLLVEDANGRSDVTRGEVTVPEIATIFGSAGSVDEILDFDTNLDNLSDGITDSLELAVGDVGDDINNTIDSALGSIGTTVRGGVVVALFALAALSATVVAWRVAKIGVMLLVGDPDMRSMRSSRSDADDDADDEPVSGRRLEAA